MTPTNSISRTWKIILAIFFILVAIPVIKECVATLYFIFYLQSTNPDIINHDYIWTSVPLIHWLPYLTLFAIALLFFGLYQILFTPRHFLRKLFFIDILIGIILFFTEYIYGKVMIYLACIGHLTGDSIKAGVTETLSNCMTHFPTGLTAEDLGGYFGLFLFCLVFLVWLIIIWKKYKPQGLTQGIHKRYVAVTGSFYALCLVAALYLTYSPIPAIALSGWQLVPWNIRAQYKVGMEEAQKQASWTLYYPDPLPSDFRQKNKAVVTVDRMNLIFDHRVTDNSKNYTYVYWQTQKPLRLSSGAVTERLFDYVKNVDKSNSPQKTTVGEFQEAYLFSRNPANAEAKVFDTLCGQKVDKTIHCTTLVASSKLYDNVARTKLLVDFAQSLKPFQP